MFQSAILGERWGLGQTKFMGKFLKRIRAIAKLPEMRTSWYFLALALGQIVAGWIWAPGIVALVLTLLDAGFFGLLVYVSFNIARTNFALKLEKNQNAGIVSGFSEGTIAYDQNFRVWSMNPAAEVICGVRKEEVIGQAVTPEWGANERFKILTQIMFPSLAPIVTKKSVATYPQVVEVSFTEPRELHLEITTNQIFDETGKLLGFLKVIRDRSREVELLKVKTEFISVAAHQLRTPITQIKWAAETFVKGDLGKLSGEQEPIIKQVSKTADKLIEMVDDFLNLAKIEEGKFGYEFEKSDLISLIQEVLEYFESLAKERNVRLIFYKPEQTPPPLLMDRRRIMLVLQNLVENAIRYNVKNGEVRVRADWLKDKPYVQVSVEDTGLGIPEKDLPRIFSKFFRSENVMRVETEGSGLGLFIVKNIVKRHGGDIWVKSVEKRGTTFTFVLPTDESLIPQAEIPARESL